MTKPFSPDDLIAVVRGRLLRARQLAGAVGQTASVPTMNGPVLSAGELQLDPNRRRVWFRGKLVQLSAREFTLLAALVQRADCVVPLEEIVQITHNIDTDFQDAGSLLRPLIRSLRRKLGYKTGEMGCIRNARGIGYEFVTAINEGERTDGVLYPLRASQS